MSDEKTEQPTEHRLRKAREDGQIAKSKDFTQTLLMGALFAYTLADAGNIFRRFGEILILPSQLYGMNFRDALAVAMNSLAQSGTELMVPYLLIVLLIGVFAEMIQSGVIFSFKVLMPKADKLNPIANLKQMFSMKSIVEFLKSVLKVAFLTVLVYVVIRDSLNELLLVPIAGVGGAGVILTEMVKTLIIYTFVAFGAIAILDFIWQKHSHIKSLMMSMDEIKQEYKQLEGDPHVKSHRRELAKEIAMGEMTENTRKASVVVTNPIHFAISIYYEEGETPLPVVLSKGEGAIAREIVRIAKEEGIPIMQNIPLAHELMSKAQLNQFIPSELIEPVAEVLLALRRLSEEERPLGDDDVA